MGTHISRVKSVDLDAWTDEQLQSVLKWGNARANKSVQFSIKIWIISNEKQILGGQTCSRSCPFRSVGVPRSSDSQLLNMPSKIENFIRTKYESKRWVMEGAMPDPATLDTEGDDDVVDIAIATGICI